MEASGGGITLSGGEPVLQSAFLSKFLPRLKAEGINILLETAGHYSPRLLPQVLPHVDHVFFDWKSSGDASHLQDTGHDRDRIEANLCTLVDAELPFTVRLPIVPGVNTDSGDVALISKRLLSLGVKSVSLLNYNNLWESKLSWLRSERQPLGLKPLALIAELAAAYQSHGLVASG